MNGWEKPIRNAMILEFLEGKQLDSYWESTARINLWHGSVRSGKTVASIIRWLDFIAREAPDGPLLMTGKTMTTLKRNILVPMGEILGRTYLTYRKEIDALGRTIYLEGANDEGSEAKIRGETLAGHYGDEVTLWPKSYFNMALSRMSLTGAKGFFTTNPDSPNHWLRSEYLNRIDELNMRAFHFQLEDNPHLDPMFVEDLRREYTGLWYRRFILGQWVMAEGAVYDMFDEARHALSDAEIPYGDMIRYWISCDYGTVNPTVFLLVGQAKNGAMYVIDEYRWDSAQEGRQKTDVEYVHDFQEFAQGINYSKFFIPTDATSFALQAVKSGVNHVTAPNMDVLDGIRNVSTLFSNDLLFLHKERCRPTINEIEGYVWDSDAQEKGKDVPLKVDDHGPDALRYAIRNTRRYWYPYVTWGKAA